VILKKNFPLKFFFKVEILEFDKKKSKKRGFCESLKSVFWPFEPLMPNVLLLKGI